MLLSGSSLKALTIEAEDGMIGGFSDFLFDDQTWKLRWMVVDTGSWLPGRKVLVHPSAIGHADFAAGELSVHLTKRQVRRSPDIRQDQPISVQMQDTLYGYYGWDPEWSGGSYFASGMGWLPASMAPYNEDEVIKATRANPPVDAADPHLRSLAAVIGYHLEATDGSVGHIEDFMLEPQNWSIRYLVADTRTWWQGRHVLLSPCTVKTVNWANRQALLEISRAQVKGSPQRDPATILSRATRSGGPAKRAVADTAGGHLRGTNPPNGSIGDDLYEGI